MATTATSDTNTNNPPSIEIVSTGGVGTPGGGSVQATKIVHLNIGLPTATLLDSSSVSAVKRHELLARQPSYCKILNDLKEVDATEVTPHTNQTTESPRDKKSSTPNSTPTPTPAMKDEVIDIPETTEVRQAPTVVINGQPYQIVTPTGSSEALEGVISINNSGTSSSQFSNASVFLPSASAATVNHQAEEQARKREIRLLKNREAARECRNKKKEYIKCLENRVAVLENQNKALIEELKLLKELYKSQN